MENIVSIDETQYWQNCEKLEFSQCIGETINDRTISKIIYQYPSKCKMFRLFDLDIVILGHSPKEIVTQVHRTRESKMFAVSPFNFAEARKQLSSAGNISIRQLFKDKIVCVKCVCAI